MAVPFSSKRKWSGATYEGQGSWVLGAPTIVADHHQAVQDQAEALATTGMRVLLLADTNSPLSSERLPTDLRPVAFLTLGDEVRSDAHDTLQYFANQGVTVKVISGDHPATVAAIARQVGVPGALDAVDGRTLPDDPHALSIVMSEHTVFGRVTPQQKQAMVHALQSQGHVVAMTGDGVNDVLALKDSDIGIAIGSGSPASRAVAQLVLIDGQFAELPSVVAEGRRVISNIEQVANLFVTETIYAIGLAVAIGLVALPFPFLPRHLTLVGAITIGIPAFFLALAPSSARTPSGLVSRVLRFAIPTGIVAAIATFAAYQLAISEGVELTEARTAAVLVLTAIGLFALTIVSRPLLVWKRWLIGAMAGLLVLAMISPPAHAFFELDLPRVVVLMASVGILAVTGAVMIGTLYTVGWIKQVPDLLRQHPPTETVLWRRVQERLSPLHASPRPRTPAQPTGGEEPDGEPITWIDPDEEFRMAAEAKRTP